MLAVAVLGLVAISIYRFVESTLFAVRVSTEEFREKEMLTSFGKFLRVQMHNLPVRLGAVTGEPHRFNDISSDELRWISAPGSGLMTRFGQGEYNVTLTTQENDAGETEIGLRRQDIDAKEALVWLPLFKGVTGFEVRYYDTRSQEWMEKWTDLTVRPALVRVRLWRGTNPDPHEWILGIPYASASAQVPNLNFNRGRRNNRNRQNPPGEGGREQGGPRGERRGPRGEGGRPFEGGGQRPPQGGQGTQGAPRSPFATGGGNQRPSIPR